MIKDECGCNTGLLDELMEDEYELEEKIYKNEFVRPRYNCFIGTVSPLNYGNGVNAIVSLVNPCYSDVKLMLESVLVVNSSSTQVNVSVVAGGYAMDTVNESQAITPVREKHCRHERCCGCENHCKQECSEAELLYSIGGRIIGGALVGSYVVAANTTLELCNLMVDEVKAGRELIFLFSTPNNLGVATVGITLKWCEKKSYC